MLSFNLSVTPTRNTTVRYHVTLKAYLIVTKNCPKGTFALTIVMLQFVSNNNKNQNISPLKCVLSPKP